MMVGESVGVLQLTGETMEIEVMAALLEPAIPLAAEAMIDHVINVNSIIEVKEFAINIVSNGQKVCILLGAEQIAVNPGDRIGNPVNIDKVLNGH